jgi:hypothetical protein
VRESEKEMERRVVQIMEQLKILTLRFRQESEEKGEMLKEVERIICGKLWGKKVEPFKNFCTPRRTYTC